MWSATPKNQTGRFCIQAPDTAIVSLAVASSLMSTVKSPSQKYPMKNQDPFPCRSFHLGSDGSVAAWFPAQVQLCPFPGALLDDPHRQSDSFIGDSDHRWRRFRRVRGQDIRTGKLHRASFSGPTDPSLRLAYSLTWFPCADSPSTVLPRAVGIWSSTLLRLGKGFKGDCRQPPSVRLSAAAGTPSRGRDLASARQPAKAPRFSQD